MKHRANCFDAGDGVVIADCREVMVCLPQMCQFLSGQGFSDLKNVTGGIDAYSRGVDPTVPLY